VTMDYGGPASELVARATPRGGLKCFSQHGWNEDPYDRPGLQDITGPVDFTNLALAGRELGLKTALETSQRELLCFLGIESLRKRVEALDLPVMERQRNLRALSALTDPQGLGAFRVLVQQKHAPSFALPPADVETTLWTPILTGRGVEWSEA
jgi:SAM-dependent MidA family methyltransferase